MTKWLTAGLVTILTAFALAESGWLASRSKPLVDRGFQHADLSRARTESEVEALLGPPGDFSTDPERFFMGFHSGPFPTGRRVEWKDDYAIVVVYFSPDGYVSYHNIYRPMPTRSWADCIRGFFG